LILALVPYGPWLLLPFGVLAALLPYAKARNFGLVATFLTPLVVLLIDLLDVGGWRLAEVRLLDTVLASAIVLLFGYAPWPSAWQAHLARAVRGDAAVGCARTPTRPLVEMPAARIAARGTAQSSRGAPRGSTRAAVPAAARFVPVAVQPARGVPADDVGAAVGKPAGDGVVAGRGGP